MDQWIQKNVSKENQLTRYEEELIADMFSYFGNNKGYISAKDAYKLFQLMGLNSTPGDFYGREITFSKFCQTIVLKRNSGQIRSKTIKDKGRNIFRMINDAKKENVSAASFLSFVKSLGFNDSDTRFV